MTESEQPNDDDDSDLTAQLGRVLSGSQRVPDEVRDSAREAFVEREHSQVVPLAYDSLTDADIEVISDTGPIRLLGFVGSHVSADLEIVAFTKRCTIEGRIKCPEPVTAQLRTPLERVPLTVGADNRFVANDLPRGAVTILLETPSERFHTEWIVI